MDWTFHTWMGAVLSACLALFLLGRMLRKRVAYIDNWFRHYDTWFNTVFTEKRKKIFMATLVTVSAAVFIYCYYCRLGKDFFERGHFNLVYFHLVFRYFIRLFPMLVGGALLAGIIQRYFAFGRFRLPSSMLGAGAFASVVPMCSCAAVPVAHSLLLSKKMTLRAVVAFLFVMPVLNPFVMFVGTTVISLEYTVLRIASVFLLAIMTGLLMERFIGVKEEGPLGMACYSCQGCSKAIKVGAHNPRPSVLLSTYDTFFGFFLYMVIGIAIGAAVAKYLPAPVVGKYLSSNTLGLLLATTVGLPIFICSGEEIVILKPLLDLGLPMGHAIAFTIAGNGICFASLPILYPCFGKKGTILFTVCFLVGSFFVGLLINTFWR
jgi:uncharacterized membrane protein YraQ (UPF0718 family)